MKLREVIIAKVGHQYQVREWDIFPNGKKVDRVHLISRSDTKMRRKSGYKHEQLVKGDMWKILTSAEFRTLFEEELTVLIKTVTDDVVRPQRIQREDLTIHDLLKWDKHFIKRVVARLGLQQFEVMGLVEEAFKPGNHFVVQGWEFYNTGHTKKDEIDYYDTCICVPKYRAIICVKFINHKYTLATCYPMNDSPWYLNWFQDNHKIVHELPSLMEWFRVKYNFNPNKETL